MKKDIISKDVLKTLITDILTYIIRVDVDDFEFVDKELFKIEKREADIVVKTDKDIFHIEIQNSNDANMIYRMIRYYSDLKFNFKDYNIYQYVIYIGKNKLSMKDTINDINVNFSYFLIDMKKIDCHKFISIDTPDALVLSILCDTGDKKDIKKLVFDIIKRIRELTDDNEFRKYMLILEVLSENRDLKDVVREGEAMLSQVDITKLPSFELGIKRGMQQGMQQGIKDGIKKGKIEVIKSLIGIIPDEIIAQRTGIDLQIIKNLTNKG